MRAPRARAPPGGAYRPGPAKPIRPRYTKLKGRGEKEALDEMARRYMRLHPEVRVEQYAVPGNVYRQWVRTQLAGDDVPDLIAVNALDQAQVAV